MIARDSNELARLIASVGIGDRAAYRALYDATSPKLFAIALRILRDEGRAEDVLQDSFVNVWKGAAGYNPSLAAPMTWLITIVRNRALDYLRRNDKMTIELDDDLIATLETDTRSPADLASAAQDASRVRQCLERLEGGQKQAIAFAYFQGLTHSELAATLKVPMGTVKTWIRRGLEKMRTCIDGLAA